jgi:hypothetical protein
VSAKDKAARKSRSRSGELGPVEDEIKRMVKDAEAQPKRTARLESWWT